LYIPGVLPHELTTRDGHAVTVREAQRDDAAELVRFIDRASGESDYSTFGPGEFELSVEEEAAVLEEAAASPSRLFLVAVIDGEIVGNLAFAAGRRSRMSHVGEFGMSVARKVWGRGVGAAMLDCLLTWARSNPAISKVNLRVRTDNQRAVALYERRGFVLEGTLRRELRVAGVDYDVHCMGVEV
jgi:RimJ/RimL family protein N-acetyltransferase